MKKQNGTNNNEVKITVKKSRWSVFSGVIPCVIMIAAVLMIGGRYMDSKKTSPKILTTATLEKIVKVSELSTFQAVYNGIAQVLDDEQPDRLSYSVAYDAKVQAGIDFKQVKISVDGEKQKITVTLPKVEITDINVDIGSLDYMFEDKKANTSAVSEQAYKACIADVRAESEKEDAIYELAQQSAENIVKALLWPFVEQLDADYQLEIRQEA